MTQMANHSKKVLFVLPALTAGGAERVMITLMNGLDRRRFSPEFLTLNNDGPLKSIIDPSIPFHSLLNVRVSRSLFQLFRKLKQIKPDIVISTMAHMNFGLLLLKPFFPKTKFIVREAVTPDFILQEHPNLSLVLKTAYRQLYKHADLVISPAQIIIDGFKADLQMRCDNHVVLPNPVDMGKIRASEGAEYDFAPERHNTVHFISAGRLHTQKGFDQLIKALPSLNAPYDWQLTILGEGSEREALETLIAKYNLGGNVLMPGLKENPWPYFTQADCFLMPSRSEGLPNVILEALACGIPSIATKQSGGIAEIASAAADGLVSVVDGMDQFISAMNKIKPDGVTKFRQSLLPERFNQQTVLNSFENMLSGVISG